MCVRWCPFRPPVSIMFSGRHRYLPDKGVTQSSDFSFRRDLLPLPCQADGSKAGRHASLPCYTYVISWLGGTSEIHSI